MIIFFNKSIFFSDALTWLADFKQQLEQLRQAEVELKNNLNIFEANLVDSLELDKIDKVILNIFNSSVNLHVSNKFKKKMFY